MKEAQGNVFSAVLKGMTRFAVRAGLENAAGCGRTIWIFRFSVSRTAGHIVHYPPERWAVFINLNNVHRT